MIKNLQDQGQKVPLGHRLWYTPIKDISELLLKDVVVQAAGQGVRMKGHGSRLSLTWVDLKRLGASAMPWWKLWLLHLLNYPRTLPVPRESVASARRSIPYASWAGFGCRTWAEVNFHVWKPLWKGFKSLPYFIFSQTVLSRQPLGSLNNFLIAYQFKGILCLDMQLQWSLL